MRPPIEALTRVVETAAPLRVIEVRPRSAGAAGTPVEAGPLGAGRERAGPEGGRPGAASPARTFLLIHGYGASSYMWRHWAEPLTARGRVLLIDLKGFGSAPKPDDGRYAPADLARAVTDLVRELDLRGLTIVAQSLGGGVALLTALALHDEGEGRLDRLVLLASAAYRQRLPPLVPLSKRPRLSAALLKLVGPRRVIRWVLRSIVHDPDSITDDQVAEYARPMQTPEGVRAAFAVGRQILPPDVDALARRYRELDVPTLLLWGDSDRVVPLWVGERLEREIPNARLVVLEACGHVACEERPAESLAVLERFLDEHGG